MEKKRTFDKPISSVLPFIDGKYLVFTNKGNLIIDYNSGAQSSLDDPHIQITTSFPNTVSKFRSSDNKLFLGTNESGSDIYRYNPQDSSFTHLFNEKTNFISGSIFLSSKKDNKNNNDNNNNNDDNHLALIDKYGNFKLLNLNQKNQFNNINLIDINNQINQINQDFLHHQQNNQQQQQNHNEQQQIQQLEQQISNIPVILESSNQFSLKETCLKLYQLPNSKIITCSLLGSVILFGKLSILEYKVLLSIQNALLKFDKNTKPITNNDHFLYRSEIGNYKNVLDGDLLNQFLFLNESIQLNLLKKLFKIENNINLFLILNKIQSLIENFKSL